MRELVDISSSRVLPQFYSGRRLDSLVEHYRFSFLMTGSREGVVGGLFSFIDFWKPIIWGSISDGLFYVV